MQAVSDRKLFKLDVPSAVLKDSDHARANWKAPGNARTFQSSNTEIIDATLRTFNEQFEEGLIIIDNSGRALFLNNAARRIVNGVHLRLVDGYLRASSPHNSATLRKMFVNCTSRNCGSSARLVSDRDVLLITASAIPPESNANLEAVMLLRLIDPAAAFLPSESALRDHFGFTSTEAALALEMLTGKDLAACAISKRITLNTARAHLRSMFDKTGTCRQASLVRLLLLCPRTIIRQAL